MVGRFEISSLLVAAAVLTTAPGCVTTGTYDEAVAQRDALASDKEKLAREVADLESQVGQLESSRRELKQSLESRSEEIAKLKGTYDALVRDLKTELSEGKVQIEQLRDGLRVNVAEDILFPSGSAKLDPHGREVLAKVGNELAKTPHRIEVLGHTDDVPISSRLKSRFPTNWELGAARAASVVRVFQEEGIDGGRLYAVSRGPFDPVTPNDSDENRARNRRIEIRLIPKVGDVAAPASRP
jgi:chemotaxis protein MotB